MNLLSSEIGRQDVPLSTWQFPDFSRHFHRLLSASGVCLDQVSSVDVKQMNINIKQTCAENNFSITIINELIVKKIIPQNSYFFHNLRAIVLQWYVV